MTFVGLDLHKRYITACALEATGGVVAEVRRMLVSLDALGDFLAALTGPVTVGMEVTLYWVVAKGDDEVAERGPSTGTKSAATQRPKNVLRQVKGTRIPFRHDAFR